MREKGTAETAEMVTVSEIVGAVAARDGRGSNKGLRRQSQPENSAGSGGKGLSRGRNGGGTDRTSCSRMWQQRLWIMTQRRGSSKVVVGLWRQWGVTLMLRWGTVTVVTEDGGGSSRERCHQWQWLETSIKFTTG